MAEQSIEYLDVLEVEARNVARERQRLHEIVETLRHFETPPALQKSMADMSRDPTTTPCRRDPDKWDTVPTDGTPSDLYPRVAEAINECLECPILETCTKMADELERTNPEIQGVVAGRLIQRGRTATRIRKMGRLRGWR